MLPLLWLLLLLPGVHAGGKWTLTTVAVDRTYGGTRPIKMVITATSATAGTAASDLLIVQTGKLIFASSITLTDIIIGGGTWGAVTGAVVTTSASGTQELAITATATSTAGAVTVTLQGSAFASSGQPTAGTAVSVNLKTTTAAGVVIDDAATNSLSFTMSATGQMSGITGNLVFGANGVPTTYSLSFTPGVDVTIPTAPTTSFTNLVVTATGSNTVFVGAGSTIDVGTCRFVAVAGGVTSSGSSSILTIPVTANGGVCTLTAGTSYTIPLVSQTSQAAASQPAADSAITVNIKFTDSSGNVFNSEAATGYSYTVPGLITVSTVTLTRSIAAANPIAMAITFTPTATILPTDVITITSTADSFATGSGNPTFQSQGCTFSFSSATGVRTIAFAVSNCISLPSNAAATLTLPQAYLAVNPAAGTYTITVKADKAGGTTRNAVSTGTNNYVTTAAVAMTATTTTVVRLIAAAHPLGMTVAFTPAVTIVNGDVVQFVGSGNTFVTSLSSPPTFTVGSCTFTATGFVDAKNLKFLLSGTSCSLASGTSYSAVIPAVYLTESPAAGAITVAARSFAGNSAVDINTVATGTALVGYTTVASTATTTVSNCSAIPVLFPNAPTVGLSLRFKLSLPIGITDVITITSSVAIFKTTAPTSSTVTVGDCLLTLKSFTSTVLRFTLGNSGTATCLYAANTDIDLTLAPSNSDPTLPSSATFLENNPAAGTVVKVVVAIDGGTAATTVVASAQTATAVTGYTIVGTLPPTGSAIDLLGVQNQSNLTSWVNGIVATHVQEDNATQGRIVWTKCGAPMNLRLMPPSFSSLNIVIKACGPGVAVVRTLCFIQSFNLNSLGVTINSQFPPLFGCNVDKFNAMGLLLPDVSLTMEAQYSLPIVAVVLYRTSRPAGIKASDIGGSIQVSASGNLKASLMSIPQTSLVTGSTSATSTSTTNGTTTTPSTPSSGSSDDSAVAIGVGIGVGVGVPVLLLLLGLCWYFLFGPGARAAAEPVNEVFYVADEKYGPQGNAYGYYGYPPGMA